MKHIICGGFDYAVLYEMDQNAILEGVDYFVDTNVERIGTMYLGKPILSIEELKNENPEEILILIGSIIYRTELELKLNDMGFVRDKHYMWAIAFLGDKKCKRLWKHTEWKDREHNNDNLKNTENGEYPLNRLKVAVSMIDWKQFDMVVDLGAANGRLRSLIPSHVQYIPVDYIKYTEDTVLCDINNYEFPAREYAGSRTCVFSIANIQYCEDWRWYLREISNYCDCFVLEHMDIARIAREYRRTHWTRYNALFDHEIIRYMQSLGFLLTDSVDFRLKSTLYKFERRSE